MIVWGREGWLLLLPSQYRSCSLLATGRNLAGDVQGKGFISLSFCCLGVVACKVAARCMARGKQGPICPSRTLKETEVGRDAVGSADLAFLSLS